MDTCLHMLTYVNSFDTNDVILITFDHYCHFLFDLKLYVCPKGLLKKKSNFNNIFPFCFALGNCQLLSDWIY